MKAREAEDMEIEMWECESCGDLYEPPEDIDCELCEACEHERHVESIADRKYRRAESGYPDA